MSPWIPLLNLAASGLLVVFGLYVWYVEPAHTRNRAFGLFAVAFSLGTALTNVSALIELEGTALDVTAGLRGVLLALGALGVAWFGDAVTGPEGRNRAIALAAPLVLLGSMAWSIKAGVYSHWYLRTVPDPVASTLDMLGAAALMGGFTFALLLLAVRFHHPDASPAQGRELAFLSSALVLYPGIHYTYWGISWAAIPASLDEVAFPVALLLVGLAVILAWLRNTRLPEKSGLARNVALLTAGLGLLGVVIALRASGGGIGFLARTGTVAILGFGILRHQILGIEKKVEWGVSKTTVAGVFVAVFFVAGELAETFFGEVFGPYAGVLAAGALVFAISPLQRVADRFAAKAVPGGAEAGADAEERYRREVEAALADDELTRDEERHLARRADELGLTSERALEIRERVEDEVAGGDPP